MTGVANVVNDVFSRLEGLVAELGDGERGDAMLPGLSARNSLHASLTGAPGTSVNASIGAEVSAGGAAGVAGSTAIGDAEWVGATAVPGTTGMTGMTGGATGSVNDGATGAGADEEARGPWYSGVVLFVLFLSVWYGAT